MKLYLLVKKTHTNELINMNSLPITYVSCTTCSEKKCDILGVCLNMQRLKTFISHISYSV